MAGQWVWTMTAGLAAQPNVKIVHSVKQERVEGGKSADVDATIRVA